ncbi:MAG: OmpH family outer membrane protein [Proteobacteria bacterium]|nr:OmpH family outer membrane protein [Pseudomonadota bacterium]MDA1355954.1 OmpH family outer membrane protein [Pseudomonadota bacterium]
MSKIQYFISAPLVLLALALLHAASPVAKAQNTEPVIIAVVELQAIMSDAAAAKSVKAQIEGKRTQYQVEITSEEARLRELEQELARQRSVLSPEAYAARRREFEGDVAAVQRIVVDRRRELDQAYAGGVRQLQVELSNIIAEIATERGITLVIPEVQTLFVDKSLRISREVLRRLDERLPDLTLKFGLN